MGPCIRGIGSWSKIRRTEGVYRFSLMAPGMMDFGEMEWPMGMEGWCMLKAMFMKENGLRTRPMDTEFAPTTTMPSKKYSEKNRGNFTIAIIPNNPDISNFLGDFKAKGLLMALGFY